MLASVYAPKDFKRLRVVGDLVARCFEHITPYIKAGISTGDIDRLVVDFLKSNGARSSDLGYQGYPKSICTSINDVIVHGIPSDDVILKDGDIINVDLTAEYKGFHGDASRMFMIGNVSKEARRLVEVTKQAFFEGIKYAKPGNRIGDVCHAIGEYVHSQGYSVVREFQGHGIGREMHEDPGIPNYGKAGRGIRLEPGMTLAIEPMVIQGKPNILELDDGWTIITEDGSLAAHYENTILITEKEPEILTIL